MGRDESSVDTSVVVIPSIQSLEGRGPQTVLHVIFKFCHVVTHSLNDTQKFDIQYVKMCQFYFTLSYNLDKVKN